jgi:hypothetical protein
LKIDINQDITINNINIKLTEFIEQVDIDIFNLQIKIDQTINNINNQINIINQEMKSPVFQTGVISTSPVGTGNELYSPNGADAYNRYPIYFSRAFADTPKVVVALQGLDAYNDGGTRAAVSAEDVSISGFTIVFHSWGDAKNYAMGASWLVAGYEA